MRYLSQSSNGGVRVTIRGSGRTPVATHLDHLCPLYRHIHWPSVRQIPCPLLAGLVLIVVGN